VGAAELATAEQVTRLLRRAHERRPRLHQVSVGLDVIDFQGRDDFERAFATASQQLDQSVVLPEPVAVAVRTHVVGVAAKYRLPTSMRSAPPGV
jgi:hypothetical protein